MFQWHYEGHFASELERLDHVRVKKNPRDFPDRHTRRQVRDSATERISRRRLRRQAQSSIASRLSSSQSPDSLNCPSCTLPVPSNTFSDHIEQCLESTQPEVIDEEEVDVDSEDQVETYTWAGITRVRATSLVEGGLRGPGFVSIERSDEDLVLDIEGDAEEEECELGSAQFSEADLIPPQPENDNERAELESRESIQIALTGTSSSASVTEKNDLTAERQTTAECPQLTECRRTAEHQQTAECQQIAECKQTVIDLQRENEELRQKAMCNICLGSYNTPLVSTVCWHVSCQECWLRALGSKKLCPQCKVIIQAKHLRRIYL